MTKDEIRKIAGALCGDLNLSMDDRYMTPIMRTLYDVAAKQANEMFVLLRDIQHDMNQEYARLTLKGPKK